MKIEKKGHTRIANDQTYYKKLTKTTEIPGLPHQHNTTTNTPPAFYAPPCPRVFLTPFTHAEVGAKDSRKGPLKDTLEDSPWVILCIFSVFWTLSTFQPLGGGGGGGGGEREVPVRIEKGKKKQ
ncbi:hypothetical protein E2C01_090106 [Portunus trituberculatus]|uniref:Uncharacterized protein n=1 Tax=Portunus trituberculatus TaxID=210409 RepID=A0A5B7JK13_PORTR|nr:hypothetical protein [Portunus trituberculatus]